MKRARKLTQERVARINRQRDHREADGALYLRPRLRVVLVDGRPIELYQPGPDMPTVRGKE